MRKFHGVLLLLLGLIAVTQPAFGQREVLMDHDGNVISNNEFVDIRLANPTFPDATIIDKLEDGRKTLRLQRVPQEGMTTPPFELTTIDGKRLTSEKLRGKVVVLNLWFIGCPACRDQEPKLNAFKKRFAGTDAVFVAVTPDPPGKLKSYLKTHPFDYIQAVNGQAMIEDFWTLTFPRNFVIGRDGKIVYWRSVVHAWDKFESVVRAELAK